MKKIWLIATLLLLSACTGIPNNFEKPQVTMAGLEIAELGVIEQRFIVSLRVSNPNNFSIPIDGLAMKLDINGQPFATGVSNQAMTLPRLGEMVVKVNVTTNLFSVWKQIKTITSKNQPIAYGLTGKLSLPLIPGGIGFDRKGELPGLGEFLPADLINNI